MRSEQIITADSAAIDLDRTAADHAAAAAYAVAKRRHAAANAEMDGVA